MSTKKTTDREVSQWRFTIADTLLPLLVALAVLKLAGLDWSSIELAGVCGGIVALWRLALMIPPRKT